ncbi:putative ABC transporter permease protein YurM [Spirochaetia bacterium]|nr:putative ABC transporter permease protein YurM [Spirochaetia bacterium]GHU33245.1 putative ABC transporter permease protein YurM [Spirochaetia bacterium]
MDVRRNNIGTQIAIYFVMAIFTVLAIYPLLWLVIQSFKTTQEYLTTSKLSFPSRWYGQNYPYVWGVAHFGTLFLNSIVYTAITVITTIVLGFMASFAFAKIPNKLTPLLHGLFIIGILLTLQSILVPLFLVEMSTNLLNTRLGVLIPYIGLALPMAIYLGTDFIRGIPGAIIESARIDGAKYLRIFSSIILPMAAPVAMTLGIITFTGTWNEFLLITILTDHYSTQSIPVGISKFSGALASDYSRQFAALVMGVIPMILFYVIFRKQITKGVAAGAVKG